MKSQRRASRTKNSRPSSTQSSSKNSKNSSNSKQSGSDQSETDAVELIKADHRHVESLFEQYESAEDSQKQQLIEEICKELTIHAMIEEEILYQACREKGVEAKELDEAQVEHDTAKILIMELMTGGEEEYRDAKVKVLSEYIKHHVGEEESEDDGILAKAREAGVDMKDLGSKLKARKEELMADLESEDISELSFPSFHSLEQVEESTMARQYGNNQDRDEYGRFQGSQGGGGYGRSSRYEDDYQRGGRDQGRGGWFGDSEGHSEAAREGWRNREGGGYGRGGQGGYDEGYGRGNQGGWRNEGREQGQGRAQGQGGWFGDYEGHSQASRQGWENRRREDDYRRGGGYGGGSGRSGQGGGRNEGRDQGQGGWFGDPEGHSEAARRGWETRYEEGNYGRSGGRGGQGGGRGEGRDQGQGGWFGDPEGHSEAARRGWRNRE